ncbi:MAG: carboxypeptidase-like regulatory domain-containing protein [Cyclobacteriaceae bacterium]|nr:carboxypeptidase-like regulatory domain-containing protein [Cyclobacteriaceae bacterium]
MIKRLTFILTILTTTTCWSQLTVTGKVIFNEDNSAAPGVDILEKGTKNVTTTKSDGTFSITVSNPNATLVFTFIGVRPQEFQLKGKSEILVKLKLDCNKDFFDTQQIHIYANSGLINNPIGGQIDIASPWILRGIIKGSYSYQTNLEENKFQNGKIELSHFISTCDFDMDFKWNYRQSSFNNELDFRANSFETDLNLRNINLIAGYTHLDITKTKIDTNNSLEGVVVGIGKEFGRPLFPTAYIKTSIYKDKIEYQASIQGGYKRLLFFIKFYKLDSFNELSLGIGAGIGY